MALIGNAEARTGDYALSASDRQKILDATDRYNAAAKIGDTDAMKRAHQDAEDVRAGAGYSSVYDDAGNQRADRVEYAPVQTKKQDEQTSRLQAELDAYRSAYSDMIENQSKQYELLQKQFDQKQDYATQQAVTELERQYQDSINLYNQERSKNAYSANQAADNLALYNSRTGNKGGIGSKLYSDQQANYDAQMVNIDLAQAKLKTDIERQVADAKAQGDYAKAQAILELGIQKMQDLTNQTNQYYNTTLNVAGNLDNYDLTKRNQDFSYFQNLLNLGVFDAAAAKELGIPEAEAQDYANYVNKMRNIDLRMAEEQLRSTYQSGGKGVEIYDLNERLRQLGATDRNTALGYLQQLGYTNKDVMGELADAYEVWLNDRSRTLPNPSNYIYDTPARVTLDYNEDEGTFVWNGKVYSDARQLITDMQNANLTDEEYNQLARQFKAYGFTAQF